MKLDTLYHDDEILTEGIIGSILKVAALTGVAAVALLAHLPGAVLKFIAKLGHEPEKTLDQLRKSVVRKYGLGEISRADSERAIGVLDTSVRNLRNNKYREQYLELVRTAFVAKHSKGPTDIEEAVFEATAAANEKFEAALRDGSVANLPTAATNREKYANEETKEYAGKLVANKEGDTYTVLCVTDDGIFIVYDENNEVKKMPRNELYLAKQKETPVTSKPEPEPDTESAAPTPDSRKVYTRETSDVPDLDPDTEFNHIFSDEGT